MNCLEYVESRLSEKTYSELEDILVSRSFITEKSLLNFGDVIVFVHGYHVGFGTVMECYELLTDEFSDGIHLKRTLSLYDSALKVALINPILEKGKKKNEQSNRTA